MKIFQKQTSRKIIYIAISVALFFGVAFSVSKIKAGVGQSGFGWLWGGSNDGVASPNGPINSGFGWVSMNDANPTAGGTVSYGVVIPTSDGQLSGYAWSSAGINSIDGKTPIGIGWIDFNPQDNCKVAGAFSSQYYFANSCTDPDGGYGGVFRMGNTLTGWARIVSVAQATYTGNSGDWQGWIKLSGASVTASSPLSLSGSGAYNSCSGDGLGLTKLEASGNEIKIFSNAPNNCGSVHTQVGAITFPSGTTLSGSGGYFSNPGDGMGITKVEGSGNKINIYRTSSSGVICIEKNCTVPAEELAGSIVLPVGMTASGSGSYNDSDCDSTPDRMGITKLEASGDKINIYAGCQNPWQLAGAITITDTAGGTPFSYGVTINDDKTFCRPGDPTTIVDASGINRCYAWSNELGWIDFSGASINVKDILKVCSGCTSSSNSLPALAIMKGSSKNYKACKVFSTESTCNGDDVTSDSNWSIDDSNIATADQPGKVTGVDEGNTNLTVSSGTLPSVTLPVKVTAYVAACNNGIQDAGESCDDGINNGPCPKTCSNACKKNNCDKNWKEVAP